MDEAERICGNETKELMELRTVEKATSWFTVEGVKVYGLEPGASFASDAHSLRGDENSLLLMLRLMPTSLHLQALNPYN